MPALCFLESTVEKESSMPMARFAVDLTPLLDAAKQHGIHILCGIDERDDTLSRSTLYNTYITIDPDGQICNKHRKLMPTNPERMVWGFGDRRTQGENRCRAHETTTRHFVGRHRPFPRSHRSPEPRCRGPLFKAGHLQTRCSRWRSDAVFLLPRNEIAPLISSFPGS